MQTPASREAPTAIVLGASADIGEALSQRLLNDGYRVVGLARDVARLADFDGEDRFTAIECDLSDRSSIARAREALKAADVTWSLFVSAAGTMEPIGRFMELDFDAWESSVTVNSTAQLRVLHGLWELKDQGPVHVMLMAGGGTNNAFTNYSAYCVSKIALIKMCELLDDEEDALNVFIIGPGFVRTRIHQETLNAAERAGDGFRKTLEFLESEGTSMDEIYANMKWCMSVGKTVAGGRNFSTVHDSWRGGGKELAVDLADHPDAYRLRRAAPKR